jgi:hypothetical protein
MAELAVLTEHVERGLAHAGHDPHRHRDERGVGELHADVGLVRSEWAHRERDHVHRAAGHRAVEESRQRVTHLAWLVPVVVGPASSSWSEQMNVRSSTRAVSRVRAREIRVGAFSVGEPLERAGVDEPLTEAVVLLGRPVAPVDGLRAGELGDLLDPRPASVGAWSGRRSDWWQPTCSSLSPRHHGLDAPDIILRDHKQVRSGRGEATRRRFQVAQQDGFDARDRLVAAEGALGSPAVAAIRGSY